MKGKGLTVVPRSIPITVPTFSFGSAVTKMAPRRPVQYHMISALPAKQMLDALQGQRTSSELTNTSDRQQDPPPHSGLLVSIELFPVP